jgi:hypothetical protein
VKGVHHVDQVVGGTNFGRQSGIQADFFVEVTNNTDGAVMLFVDSHISREVIDGLETGVGRAVAPLTQNMPLLSENRVDASVFDGGLTTIVKAIKY